MGPLQVPISDVAVFAQSHQDITGIATSIGEQVGPWAAACTAAAAACGRVLGCVLSSSQPLQVPTDACFNPATVLTHRTAVLLPLLLSSCTHHLHQSTQPLKGLLDPAAMARLAMGEALTNLCWASATSLADVKASVNWMYAAKMKSEGAAMYEAACALR